MKRLSKEEKMALKAAANEAPFSAKSLLAEITPLIKSYFIGTPIYEHNALKLVFLNGQAFRISVKEVTEY